MERPFTLTIVWTGTTSVEVENAFGSKAYVKELKIHTWALDLAAGTPHYAQLQLQNFPLTNNTSAGANESMIFLPLGPGQVADGAAWTGRPVPVLKLDCTRKWQMPSFFTATIYTTGTNPVVMPNLTSAYVVLEGVLLE